MGNSESVSSQEIRNYYETRRMYGKDSASNGRSRRSSAQVSQSLPEFRTRDSSKQSRRPRTASSPLSSSNINSRTVVVRPIPEENGADEAKPVPRSRRNESGRDGSAAAAATVVQAKPWLRNTRKRRLSAPPTMQQHETSSDAHQVDTLKQYSSASSLLDLRAALLESHKPFLAFDDTGCVICLNSSCKSLFKEELVGKRAASKQSINLQKILLPSSVKTLAQALRFLQEQKPLETASIFVQTVQGYHIHMRIRRLQLRGAKDLKRVFFVASVRQATPEEAILSSASPANYQDLQDQRNGMKKSRSMLVANLMKMSQSMRRKKEEQFEEVLQRQGYQRPQRRTSAVIPLDEQSLQLESVA